jgi:hypothetical protein
MVGDVKTCAREGCARSLEGKRSGASYCSDACRRHSWAARTGYRVGTAGNGSGGRPGWLSTIPSPFMAPSTIDLEAMGAL